MINSIDLLLIFMHYYILPPTVLVYYLLLISMQIVFDLLLSFVACLDHFIAFLTKFLICLLNIFSFIAIYWHFNSFFFNRFIAVLYIPFHYKIYDFYRHLFVYSLNYYYCLDNIAFSQIIIWLLLVFLRNFYQEFSTSLDNFVPFWYNFCFALFILWPLSDRQIIIEPRIHANYRPWIALL